MLVPVEVLALKAARLAQTLAQGALFEHDQLVHDLKTKEKKQYRSG